MNPSSFTEEISVKVYEFCQEMRGEQLTGVAQNFANTGKDKQRHLRLCCQVAQIGTNEDAKTCPMKDSKTAFCCARCTNLLRPGKSYLCITRETASRTITLE